MILKPMTVTAGAILALALSGQAWTGDVKTMAADPTKVVPSTTDPTKVVPSTTDPTKVVPSTTDPTKAAKEKVMEMGKDKATDTVKGAVK